MKVLTTFVFATALLVAQGCDVSFSGIPGSGVAKTEQRTVDDFHAISASGTAAVNVVVGQEKSVTVTFDDNLLELLRTEVVNGELRIYTDGSYNTKAGLDIQVTVPELDSVTISGVSTLTAANVSGPSFKVNVSGVAKATVSGEVEDLAVSTSGTSKANLKDLIAKNTTVQASGTSNAIVFASQSVDAKSSGTADINVHGAPEDIKQSSSGVSNIVIDK